MNGRIYDPYIGRFMSADPFIQAPYELQSHNRYAYVMNNPLLYTDPSGFNWFKKLVSAAVILVAVVVTMGAAAAWAVAAGYGAVGSAVIAGAAAGFVGGFLGSALNGGNLSQSLKAGVIGGITGAAFGYVGGSFQAGSFQNYLGHAVVGCGSSLAQGNNCARGAASALIGKWATNNTGDWGIVGRGVAATIVGGATSSITGGRFSDGARTAAFGYLFNEVNSTRAAQSYGRGSVRIDVTETQRDGLFNYDLSVSELGGSTTNLGSVSLSVGNSSNASGLANDQTGSWTVETISASRTVTNDIATFGGGVKIDGFMQTNEPNPLQQGRPQANGLWIHSAASPTNTGSENCITAPVEVRGGRSDIVRLLMDSMAHSSTKCNGLVTKEAKVQLAYNLFEYQSKLPYALHTP